VDSHILHKKYLSEGTSGYAIIRRFHVKYSDVLFKANILQVEDVVHEVLLSLSKTDFSRVQNVDHYVLRAIKLHSWSLLDRAIRLKSMSVDAISDPNEGEEVGERQPNGSISRDHLDVIEGAELLAYVNLFKSTISPRDSRLLNLLIDETERSEIAKLLELNLNTLDTSIRRLRIRLAEFLKNLGYSYKALERFV